jgi:hypothetical protein
MVEERANLDYGRDDEPAGDRPDTESTDPEAGETVEGEGFVMTEVAEERPDAEPRDETNA